MSLNYQKPQQPTPDNRPGSIWDRLLWLCCLAIPNSRQSVGSFDPCEAKVLLGGDGYLRGGLVFL